ncbi:MAG: radical SAM protein [Myxococcales bacterium]|nr:radical SAM protein [Myxococcales bacterium]
MKLSKLCNLRCSYCYEYDELGERGRMPLDRLEWFLAGLAEHYVAADWRFKLSFVFHGGEPLLLPETYLRALVAAMHRRLGDAGVPFEVSLQTNLTRLGDRTIDLLDELRVALGVSLDVYGGQRLTIAGADSQDRALDNLQRLFDRGVVRRLGVGGISVLHARNVDRAVDTFEFYRGLGLDYRILPVFSITDPPPRMRGLTLSADRVVAAMQQVALAQLRAPRSIRVFPLDNYFESAVHHLVGASCRRYDPQAVEWALIVDTDGDAYNHAEAYLPEGRLGNVFRDRFADLLASPARAANLALRAARGRTCDECPYRAACSGIPVIEALPSERSHDLDGRLQCTVARPMIAFMSELLRADPSAAGRIADFVAERGAERVA